MAPKQILFRFSARVLPAYACLFSLLSVSGAQFATATEKEEPDASVNKNAGLRESENSADSKSESSKTSPPSLDLLGAESLELKPENAKQGQTVEVILKLNPESLRQSKAAKIELEFLGKKIRAFPYQRDSACARESCFRALLVAPANQSPGKYKVSYANLTKTLNIQEAGFAVQSIRLPKSKASFASSPGEEEAVSKAKATVTERKYWTGKFLRPSAARTSSAFGLRRRVNGELLKDYFHSGLDFAGASGSPVIAAQAGRVLLARHGWKLHGNTVCIDHGQGVVSFYIHLSKILVEEGQVVEAGKKIAAIGSTGRASGPHLHFSIYVSNEATNPAQWFQGLF